MHMARLKKGILGGFSGKLGNLVGSKRSGSASIAQYREGDTIDWSTQTDAERTRMSNLCQFFSNCPDEFITTFWPQKKKYCTSFFTAISDNYHVQPYTGYFVPHYEMVKKYKMTSAQSLLSSTWRASGSRSFAWFSTQIIGNQRLDDLGTLVMYAPSASYLKVFMNVRLRSASPYSFIDQPLPVGTPYWSMIFWRSQNGKLTSRPIIRSGVVLTG